MLDDALAVALVEPEVEEDDELAADPLCALPSELERLAVRAPSAPERAFAEIELALAQEEGLLLVREDEKMMSAHYNGSVIEHIEARKRKLTANRPPPVSPSVTTCKVAF